MTLELLNNKINSLVWDGAGLGLLIFAGVFLTAKLRFFQITKVRLWLKNTLGSILRRRGVRHSDDASISQWGALCTALAATVGVGNIAGVASAIVCGGPGAVFWMWVAAALGMIISYAENALGIFYRRKNKRGEWVGGAMYYLRDGLARRRGFCKLGKMLSVLFAVFCVLASFGIGNAGQVQAIVVNFTAAFPVPSLEGVHFCGLPVYPLLLGLAVAAAAGTVILGGLKRASALTERMVPVMVVGYVLCSLVIIFLNFPRVVPALGSILRHALRFRAFSGGAAGFAVKEAVSYGFKRGVFSNEAGMGSATIVNASANTREPVEQGMWGIFQVFVDTVVMCSMTALTVLCSGLVDLESGALTAAADGAALVSQAFSLSFGSFGAVFIALSVLLFAFSTVIGWSCFGCRAWEFLFGERAAGIYRLLFVAFILPGAVMRLDLAWSISDTFNGLMMIPNLLGVLLLSPIVFKMTRNYIDRKINGKNVRPMLSYDPIYQREGERRAKTDRFCL